MSVRGRLTSSNIAYTMPVHADPLGFEHALFKDVNQVTFSYRTTTEHAVKLLPSALEVDENPQVSVMFLNYGFSSVGPFREYIQLIHARFRGEEVGFVPHIFITNERGMIAGREREGYPKLLAEIDFDMDEGNVYGLVPARLSRPAGFPLVNAIFRPSQRVGEITPENPQLVKAVGLRVIGSAVPGRPPSICELVPSALEFVSGEIWSGDGSLCFTGASGLSAVHELPIIGAVKAFAYHRSAFNLKRPEETFPLS